MALMKQQIISETLWDLKCPYSMEPSYITIHNTANNASASQEVAYLKKNTASTSCHIFVDETEAIQCLPLDRNAWHAGDGSNGTGNRCSIGVEICRSTDYETDRHHLAMLNAAEIVRQLMREYKIPLDHVVQHNHWSGKDCPHRIREEGMWETFLSLCTVSDKEEGDEFMEFKEGYQKISWQGQIVHVYKRKSNQDIGLMSAGGDRVLKTITLTMIISTTARLTAVILSCQDRKRELCVGASRDLPLMAVQIKHSGWMLSLPEIISWSQAI